MSTYVGKAQGESTGLNDTSKSATFDVAPANGDFVAVWVVVYKPSAAAPTLSVTDNKGNTYTAAGALQRMTAYDEWGQWFYCKNVVGGGTFTITAAPDTGISWAISLIGYGFSAPTGSVDGAQVTAEGNSTAVTSGAITSSAAAVLLSGMSTSGAQGTVSAGWTSNNNISYIGMSAAWRIEAASGTFQATWTVGAAVDFRATTFAFLEAAAGGGGGGPTLPWIPVINSSQGGGYKTAQSGFIPPNKI